MSTRVKLVGLLAIPVIALVAVAFAFGIGNSTTDAPKVEASSTGTMVLNVKDGSKTCIVPVAGQICVAAGNSFTVSAEVTASPTEGYNGLQAWIQFSGADLKFQSVITTWPDCEPATEIGGSDVNNANAGCLTGVTVLPDSFFTGNGFDFLMNCQPGVDSKSTINLLPLGDLKAQTLGSGFNTSLKQVAASDSIVIHCQVPPTPTNTNTPTETFTPTPTNTAVAQPPFVKSPAQQNLWLTRQGDKIPPVQCVGPQGSNNTAAFDMSLGVPIAATDPKGSGKVVDLGAFEFEVHYDAQKVCVEIQRAQASITMTCFIQDDVTKPVLEGVARIGCVTVGKKIDVNGIWALSISALGGALTSNCVVFIQEAPVGIPTFPFPVKGAMIVTGPPGLDLQPADSHTVGGAGNHDGAHEGDQNCVGTTGSFGWVSIPGVAPFDNQTGNFAAVIPCNPPSLGTSCSDDGVVIGSFFQEPTTLEMAINATFTIDAIVGGNPVPISDGVIVGTRTQRLALDLATIIVRPQPDVYSQAIPNQGNGVVVQLNNQKCAIADQQGHPIESFSCEDADVTIRYLEGDVEPDCKIDTLDTQSIAFRWGASKGTLLFLDRFNLEPFGTQSDDDIDIKDLQAVYGRFGSTCANPHPDQPPVNPKA